MTFKSEPAFCVLCPLIAGSLKMAGWCAWDTPSAPEV
eukprot:CAMPEP_0174374942 /NCGR_PEP_ID=MMETSP0811_2-20130205/112740_1 /TAXON_ID=73025 ORGANISM="Eutreptiella gymnastica-like, Strain CCMP1594" /NCGR_SAMPLE_ID=MMETSP0811_2 /ASSEMBLY_ACC=CAM_ASM_000667 /LENGTH=36 /DNA_ID= /DNA_START= /DNA_END= /DNA_ORIENTATION=